MKKDDIICMCSFVFKEDIIKSGIKDFDELQLKLNVGRTCGKCTDKAKDFLKEL